MGVETQRSCQTLKKDGYIYQIVERWNSYAKIRVDLFGVIDIVAVKADITGVLGVQSTSTDHIMDRIRKALAEPRIRVWLEAQNRFQVWGWAKRGERGKRKLWTLKIKELALAADGSIEVKGEQDANEDPAGAEGTD